MNADDAQILLSEMLPLLTRAAARLEESLQSCAGMIPADTASYECLEGLELALLDALGVRFARCQEIVGKTMRSLAVALGVKPSPFPVMLDGLRREGLELSAADWEPTRILRNQTGHAYLMTAADFVKYYREVASVGPLVVDAARRVVAFATQSGISR